MSHKYNERRYNNGFATVLFTKSLSDSVTSADSVVTFTVGKGLADTISFTEVLARAMTVLKSDTVTITETTGKDATAHFFDAVASSDFKSAEPDHKLFDGILLGDHLLTIEVEISDTVRLEDWISLRLIKRGVWTEGSAPSGSWTEVTPPSATTWTTDTPPSDDPWSH